MSTDEVRPCPHRKWGCTVLLRDAEHLAAHLNDAALAHCELLQREIEIERSETALHRQSMKLAQSRAAAVEDDLQQLRQQLAHLPALLQLLQLKDRMILEQGEELDRLRSVFLAHLPSRVVPNLPPLPPVPQSPPPPQYGANEADVPSPDLDEAGMWRHALAVQERHEATVRDLTHADIKANPQLLMLFPAAYAVRLRSHVQAQRARTKMAVQQCEQAAVLFQYHANQTREAHAAAAIQRQDELQRRIKELESHIVAMRSALDRERNLRWAAVHMAKQHETVVETNQQPERYTPTAQHIASAAALSLWHASDAWTSAMTPPTKVSIEAPVTSRKPVLDFSTVLSTNSMAQRLTSVLGPRPLPVPATFPTPFPANESPQAEFKVEDPLDLPTMMVMPLELRRNTLNVAPSRLLSAQSSQAIFGKVPTDSVRDLVAHADGGAQNKLQSIMAEIDRNAEAVARRAKERVLLDLGADPSMIAEARRIAAERKRPSQPAAAVPQPLSPQRKSSLTMFCPVSSGVFGGRFGKGASTTGPNQLPPFDVPNSRESALPLSSARAASPRQLSRSNSDDSFDPVFK